MEQQNTQQNQNAAPQITLKSIFSGDILGHKISEKASELAHTNRNADYSLYRQPVQ